MKPTERQILGANLRAEAEKYEVKNRKKVRGGGWELSACYRGDEARAEVERLRSALSQAQRADE